MRIRWMLIGVYLLGNALSLLLFWLALQVDTGIELKVNWLALALVIILPGVIVFFFSSQLEIRLHRIAKALQGIVRGNYRPSNLPEYTREMSTISREIFNLSQQVKESIQTQRQETLKLQAILKGMQEGVISLDHVGRILLLNHAAEKMFGVNQEGVHNKYFTELTFSEGLEDLVTSALEQGQQGNKEFTLGNKIIRGEVNPIHGEKGRPRGVVIVCYDITELRRLEQVRTEFVGNVSHELRTPLTSIKGFVETLIDGAAEAPHLRKRFLNIIHHETLRLQRLVDELLALSRIENTQHQVEEAFSSVQEAYNKIRPVIEPYAEAKKINLEVKIPERLPEVAMSIDLLSQVLLNLMENAVKYTTKGKVWLHVSFQDPFLRLEFGDTGSGIPEADQPRIFERFYRVDKARSREQGGTGLGLSIVKHIVEGAKGKISVRSQVGVGSLFICELPVKNGERKNGEKLDEE